MRITEPALALFTIAGTKSSWPRLATLWMIVHRHFWLVAKGKSHLYSFPLLGNISKAAGVVQVHSHLIERAGHQVDSRDAQMCRLRVAAGLAGVTQSVQPANACKHPRQATAAEPVPLYVKML
jgi:hypothetical protein